jgi:ATP-binding cassette subfamily B protein
MSMPQGYDTLVGERGFSLSGGQRQRVSIARSVLKDPDILIFDEATSELDTEAESKVKDMLAKVDCTCIVITHRLSFLDFVDKVVVLNEGRVVRSGSPGDLYPLIKEDGPFSFVKGG